jgi:hypothetical protein
VESYEGIDMSLNLQFTFSVSDLSQALRIPGLGGHPHSPRLP